MRTTCLCSLYRPGALGTTAAYFSVSHIQTELSPLSLQLALLSHVLLLLAGGGCIFDLDFFFIATPFHCLSNMILEVGHTLHAPLHMCQDFVLNAHWSRHPCIQTVEVSIESCNI